MSVASKARLLQLAEEFGTPLYVYSGHALRARIAELRRAMPWPALDLLFATMANDNAHVLREISGQGVGACVNSISHLRLAIECGFPSSSIQFTSTGISAEDMAELQERGISVNLDSPLQVRFWCARGGVAGIGVRVNAASLRGDAPGDRIGIDVANLSDVCRAAESLGGFVRGVHVYAGTNFTTPAPMFPVLERLFDVAARVPRLEYVNIGGGVGINYGRCGEPFDLTAFGQRVSDLANMLSSRQGRLIRVVFEPGRGLAGTCGAFLTRVTDVKNLRGRWYVAVDGSVSVFPRPLLHPESHHQIEILGEAERLHGDCVIASIVGRTTFSRDILGEARLPPRIQPGAVLLFHDAGAYCQSMRSRFLGQGEPKAVIVDQ